MDLLMHSGMEEYVPQNWILLWSRESSKVDERLLTDSGKNPYLSAEHVGSVSLR